MTPFEEAFEMVMGEEGVYSFNPFDPGGETYCGIARNKHPKWSGWEYLDMQKTLDNFKVRYRPELKSDVMEFYKDKFWDRISGDELNKYDNYTPLYLFDSAVNIGVGRASRFFQRVLNLLNSKQVNKSIQKLYEDMPVDGLIGKRTINAFRNCIKQKRYEYLWKTYVIIWGNHYIDIMESDPKKEIFVGWISRLKIEPA